MSFKSFEKNIRSQFGEDGVIEEVFRRIGVQKGLCVEFGAWDGIHLSNAWNLWSNLGWDAILIEGDKSKFTTLVANTKDYANVRAINVFVDISGNNSLDAIFPGLSLKSDIDLLSIDIDGNDYYIFENLKNHRPRLIIVEYNPTIPPGIDLVQTPGAYFGCSAQALHNLGKSKDYRLIHMTDTNMFFVRAEDFNKLGIDEPSLESLFPKKYLTYVFTSYDGTPFLTSVPVYMDPMKKEKSKPVRLPFNANGQSTAIPVSILEKITESK